MVAGKDGGDGPGGLCPEGQWSHLVVHGPCLEQFGLSHIVGRLDQSSVVIRGRSWTGWGHQQVHVAMQWEGVCAHAPLLVSLWCPCDGTVVWDEFGRHG
eukprot:38840-Amphidinium_carterae.1